MEKQFGTMSTEMIEKEIRLLKESSKTLTQQEKLMLFALETEHEKRVKERIISEEEKLKKLLEEFEFLFTEYQKIDYETIRSDVLVPNLLRFYHMQKDMAQMTNKLIDGRQKK